MKNKDFSSVPSDSVRRTGQSPNLGKLTRSPQSALRRKRSRRNRSAPGPFKKTAMLWAAALGSVVLVALVLFFIVSYFPKPEAEVGEITALETPVAISERAPGTLETLGEQGSLSLVRSALQLTDPSQVEDLFILTTPREPAEVLSLLERYRKTVPIESYSWLGGKLVNNGYTEEVLVTYKNEDREFNRIAQIWKQPDGAWRIDFDAYARHVSPDWATILSGESPVSVVRAFIADDTYYNGVFRDDSEWQSFSLISPDTLKILVAYARRGSPQHLAINKALQTEQAVYPVTLELIKPPGSAPLQFEISRVLAENWSIRPQSFDGL